MKMKIRYCSDLHMEVNENLIQEIIPFHKDDKETILCVAGDIHNDVFATSFIMQLLSYRFKAVVFVVGNHDFEGKIVSNDSYHAYESFTAQFPNVHFLWYWNPCIRLEGIDFIGSTGWCDPLASETRREYNYLRHFMNEYRYLKTPEGVLTPFHLSGWHTRDKWAILENVTKLAGDCNKIVVLSHHCPVKELKEIITGRPINYHALADRAYYNDWLEDIPEDMNIQWVYGHIHKNAVESVNGNTYHVNCYGNDANKHYVPFAHFHI